MRSTVLTSGILAAAMALATMGCEEPPKPQPKPTKATPAKTAKAAKAKPKPKKLTDKEKIAKIQTCWKAANAKDDKAFADCYSERTRFELVDYLPPAKLTGWKNIQAAMKPERTAFPDMNREIGKIFVRGNDAVVLYSAHGTNKGEMMGQEPTDKAVGIMGAQLLRLAPDGKTSRELHYMDQGTFMGQLGLHDMPVRAVREAGKWGETQIVVAKNDKNEKANLAAYRKLAKAMGAKEIDPIMELYADDAVFSYMAGKEDAKGKDAVKKSFEEWFKVSTDAKDSPEWSWAAGDYVLAAGKSKGTNDGALMGGKPATNKTFEMRALEVIKFEEGKIKEHWMYGNGFKFAVDLGLAEDPAAMAKKDGDDKGDKEEKAAAKDDKAPPKDKKAAAKPEPAPASTPKKSE